MPMRLVKLIAWFYTDARVRKLYLKRLGVNIGENTYTNLGFRIVSDDYEERAFIGKNVSIAPNVTLIVCSSANNGDEINRIAYVRDKLTVQSRIVIEDEVWIGANVTILPGVCVGRCAVVGAGSLVVKDVEPYTIVAGTPAKPIRKLDGL
ncbi:MAG: galactoside O-acetyltransferase [Lachnospiraceae bacterium]|nr:galactoside O-acetyltransferase [Lachnospiraceae bacterium]